jgi:hypothetical protein
MTICWLLPHQPIFIGLLYYRFPDQQMPGNFRPGYRLHFGIIGKGKSIEKSKKAKLPIIQGI